jgi:hypothetical protein
MPMLQNTATPALPTPPEQYEAEYINQLLKVLRIFFNGINSEQILTLSGINININTLPTEADLSNLRVGDVYRYTTDNTLRIKT